MRLRSAAADGGCSASKRSDAIRLRLAATIRLADAMGFGFGLRLPTEGGFDPWRAAASILGARRLDVDRSSTLLGDRRGDLRRLTSGGGGGGGGDWDLGFSSFFFFSLLGEEVNYTLSKAPFYKRINTK